MPVKTHLYLCCVDPDDTDGEGFKNTLLGLLCLLSDVDRERLFFLLFLGPL